MSRYEDGAVPARRSGWECRTCGRFYESYKQHDRSEHHAKYCCASSHPCKTEDCDGRAIKGYANCEPCRVKIDEEKWQAREKFPWPEDLSKNPIIGECDHYFFDECSFHDHMADEDIPYDELRLQIGEFQGPPIFEVNEWLSSHLPEDGEADSSVDEQINKLIQQACPPTFYPTGQYIDPDTIPKS